MARIKETLVAAAMVLAVGGTDGAQAADADFCRHVAGDALTLAQMRLHGYTQEQFIVEIDQYYHSEPAIQEYLVNLGRVVFESKSGGDLVDLAVEARDVCLKEEWTDPRVM